jgi:signal transduction histidine kinase
VKPFKLHVKTTLLISAVVLAIFSIVAFYYYRATKQFEQEELKREHTQSAVVLASMLAGQLSELRVPLTEEVAERIVKSLHRSDLPKTTLVQFYSFAGPDLFNPQSVAYPRADARPLTREQILDLRADKVVYDPSEEFESRRSVWAAAPVFQRRTLLSSPEAVGAVGVRVSIPPGRLASHLNQLAIASMVLIVLVVAVATYLLFQRLVYKPIDALLAAMARVEQGDLTVHVPPRRQDEIGLVTSSFNSMVDRLCELAEDRAAHARQLEERVQEATAEIAERNEQLGEANIQLFEMQRQLGQLERLATAGQLAAQFAHEVGTPLNLISGHVQLLRARALDERTIKRLEIIAAQIDRIERIVRDMLDQTRRPASRREPLDIGALLGRMFDTIAPTLAARNVDLEADIAPHLPPVRADGDQIQQVFINLINNSLDAMPGGGRLRIEGQAADGEVRIAVSDTGHGIAEADLPRIFDPLFTTKDRGRGTGLGLAVSQQIVRENGGRVEVRSSPGAGATFTVVLPAVEPSADPGDPPAERPLEVSPPAA